eukprot:g32715.t1
MAQAAKESTSPKAVKGRPSPKAKVEAKEQNKRSACTFSDASEEVLDLLQQVANLDELQRWAFAGGYDAVTVPLSKVTKSMVREGFTWLKAIERELAKPEPPTESLEALSQSFYKVVPLLANEGVSPSQHRAILGQAGNEYDWDKIVEAMLIQLDGGEEPQGKGWKSSYKSRQQSNYNPGGQRSWAFPIEEEWSSYEGENDEIYAVEDWQEEQVEDDIPVYEVEEDIQYDIEEMEHAIEVTTVEDLSFDELDVFAATIQKMGKGASEYARKRQPVRDGKDALMCLGMMEDECEPQAFEMPSYMVNDELDEMKKVRKFPSLQRRRKEAMCVAVLAERADAYTKHNKHTELNPQKMKSQLQQFSEREIDESTQKAVEQEIGTWQRFDAIDIIPPEESHEIRKKSPEKVISSRGVWTKKDDEKRDENEKEELVLKCRAVGRGFQEEYDEALRRDSPTCSNLLAQVICSLAASRFMKLTAADVRGAFLQGLKIDRELYFEPPKNLGKAKIPGVAPGSLLKLKKSIYGVNDAARQWYHSIKGILLRLGWESLTFELAGFVLREPTNKEVIAILALHVDDVLIAWDEKKYPKECKSMQEKMQKEDYQRDIERYQQKQRGEPEATARSSSLPPDFLGEERGIRSSQLTHLGGFRREKRDSNSNIIDVPAGVETESNASPPPDAVEAQAQNSSYLLAAEIEDQMSYMAFFVGEMVDDSPGRQMRLLADSLPELRASKRKMSVLKACISTFKAFIATGILFMPQAVTNAGWGWAIVLMVFSCIISTAGILLLGECHQHHNVSYPLLGKKAFGSYGYFLIAGQVAFSQFCFCSSYYIFISTTLQNICLNHGMEKPSTLAIMIGVASVLTPLGWIRRIGKMKVVNIIGDGIILFAILSVAVVAVFQIWRDGASSEVVAFAPPSKVLVFAGTSVYAFEGIALVIPIREGMEKPELFPHMLVGALGWV